MPAPIVPRYRPVTGFGFMDGFIEQRGGVAVASSESAFGRDAATLGVDVTQTIVRLVAQDGGHARAIMYARGGEKTAIFLMHPRADVSSHYLVPALLDAGYAVLAVQGRYFNNDEDCLHEALLADAAAAIQYLREAEFDHVVLLGNSGGGSLFGFYQAMAQTPPPGRPTHTPGGRPYDLNALDIPEADGLLLLAAHLGEGKVLLNLLDPSVTNEADPLSCDPTIDMYNPANGFRRPPQVSTYSGGFVQEYRAAQVARCARIDALAHQQLAENRRFAAMAGADWFSGLSADEQLDIERRSVAASYLLIARTDADPASCDLSIEPSARVVGSLVGPRPDLQNYQLGYFGHCMTPEGWLSTWSGLSSRASLVDTIAGVTVPTYVVNYLADNAIFPSHAEAIYEASGAADKSLKHIDGDHYGVGASGKALATKESMAWLTMRYPTRSGVKTARNNSIRPKKNPTKKARSAT